MFHGGLIEPSATPSGNKHQAYVRILEQPASKSIRFRYQCEGRSAGSLTGQTSSVLDKKYPEIEIVGYKGEAVIVVSCVTKDPPYRPHPFNLVGRNGCNKGVCSLRIDPETMKMKFPQIGVQCVKIKDIESSLRVRQEIRVDPFRTGFDFQQRVYDLNALRLCFQVFLEGDIKGKFNFPLKPVVSDIIYNRRHLNNLNIFKISECVCYANGGMKDVILLCDKINKSDIQVWIFEEMQNVIVWESMVEITMRQIHKNCAIWFKPPPYWNLNITEPVNVFVQLRRYSDGAVGAPIPFQYIPLRSEPGALKRKRSKIDSLREIYDQIKQDFSTKDEPISPNFFSPQFHLPSAIPTSVSDFNVRPSVGGESKQNEEAPLVILNSEEINQLAYNFQMSEQLPEILNLSDIQIE